MTQYSFPIGRGGSFTLDSEAIAQLLVSTELIGVVQEAANAVARELLARGHSTVYVDTYATDRRAAGVTIVGHGTAAELLNGDLINAATAVGLQVNGAV